MSDLSPKYGSLVKGLFGSARAVFQFMIIPIILILVASSLLEGMGSRSLLDLDRAVLGLEPIFLVFGSILTIISFFYSFYPAGSWSRLLFGQIRAAVEIVLGFVLFTGAGLHDAIRTAGPDIDLVSLFFLLVVAIGLGMLYIVGEWADNRQQWLRAKAAIDGTPFFPKRQVLPEDPNAHRVWHDFRFRYGRFTNGIRMASGAMIRFVIIPVAIVIIIQSLISSMGNTMTDQLSSTLGSTMTLLFLVGIPIAVLSFFKGFYPKGSVSRMGFSMAIVALLDLWIWFATLQGRFQADLGTVQVNVDYQPYVLLLILGVSLWALYYLVEMISYRKDWIAQGFQPVNESRAAERRLREKELRKAGKNKQQS
jgi:hypothetical protein